MTQQPGHDGCDHDWDAHVMIATTGDPVDGGITLCPHPGCECLSTWDVPPFSNKESVVMPSAEALAEMRTAVQGES